MFLTEVFNLGKAYKQYFELVPAYSETLKDDVYRIRHQVYCEDLAFEPQRPNRRESDEYDAHSIHLLIRSLQTNQFVGCTRLIRASPTAPDLPLPFEKACAATLDRSIIDPGRLPRHAIAEVSRLAVVSQFRRRKGDDPKSPVPLSDADFGTPAQPRFPYIPISLYLGTVELARLNQIDTLFILTERRLAGHFRKLGVNVQTIGGPVEHRGERIPSMLSIQGILKDMRSLLRPLYKVVAAEVAKTR